jgi:para-nitrobenzyl esterase
LERPNGRQYRGSKDCLLAAISQNLADHEGQVRAIVHCNVGIGRRELTRRFFPVASLHEGISARYGPLTSQAFQVYGLKDGKEPAPDPVYGATMAQWATDSQFRCGTVAQLIWRSRAGNMSYQYEFSRVAPGRESVGAAHASELPYVFGTLSVAGRPAARAYMDLTASGPVAREGLRSEACDLFIENNRRK